MRCQCVDFFRFTINGAICQLRFRTAHTLQIQQARFGPVTAVLSMRSVCVKSAFSDGKMIESLIAASPDLTVAAARLVLGVIFFAHGAQKMFGWYGGPGFAQSMRTFTEHLHLPSVLAFLVILGELAGGVGLIVGLFSRLSAAVIALTMVGAVVTVHSRYGLFLNWYGNKEGHGIEYHLLAIALALVVTVKGGGAFSLDRVLERHASQASMSHQHAALENKQLQPLAATP